MSTGTVLGQSSDLCRHHVLAIVHHHFASQHLFQLGYRQVRQGAAQQPEAQVPGKTGKYLWKIMLTEPGLLEHFISKMLATSSQHTTVCQDSLCRTLLLL